MWPQVITLSLAYFLVVTRPITSPSVISIFCRQKKFSLFLIRQVEEREEIKFNNLKEKKSEEYEHLRHYQKTTTILLKKKRDGNVY